MNQYLFVHIFWLDEIKFSPSLIQYINDPENGFDVSQHFFVLVSPKVYEMCRYDNVVLDDQFQNDRCANLINKYAERAEALIVHSLCDPIELLKIKSKYLSKIVWRSWGHDAIFPYQPHQGKWLSNFAKHILEKTWKRRIKFFKAICGANLVDEIDIREKFGNVQTYPFLYRITGKEMETIGVEGNLSAKKNDGLINILVGHSGYDNDNHIFILNKLMAYREENVHIYLVLTYGQKDYIDTIKKHVSEQWGEKATIIEEFVPYEQYRTFVQSIDIAILDGRNSYALGNVTLLLRAKKKLIVNPMGVIRKAFDQDAVPYLTTDTAFDLPFIEFAAPAVYREISCQNLLIKTREEQIQLMKVTFACIAGNEAE